MGIFVRVALILRYVPDVSLRWDDVWQGASATALLFTAGKALLGLYLGKAAVGSPYGAAGSLIVVIVWVYYSVARQPMPTTDLRDRPCRGRIPARHNRAGTRAMADC